MTKNYWIIFLGAAVIAILLFLLLEHGKQHDTHKDDKADVVADHDTLKAHGVDYKKINDSLNKEIVRLKSDNKSLVSGQAVTRRQLDMKTAEAISLAKEVQRHNRDTGEQARRIDSLVAMVESLTFLVSQYTQFSDSINNVNDSLQATNEAALKEKDKRIAELQSAYDNLYKAYMTLFKTSADLQKSLKRQKLKTKVAAVLGAAGAVLMLVK